MAEKRVRRPKQQILEEKIQKLEDKINPLLEQKKMLESELEALLEAEKKAKDEATMKELINWMSEKNYSVDDLENMMNKPE